MEYFGLKLQTLRKKASMSQLELAELVGVSRQAISKWERAEALPDLYNAKKIAEVFSITLDELMDIEIKSIDKEKRKTNKLALAFLLVPGVLGILGFIVSITYMVGLFANGGLATMGNITLLMATIYSLLYIASLYNLYIGSKKEVYKTITIILNFLLLIGLIILLIDSGGIITAGYILLFIILLSMIILGIIGGFMYNFDYQLDQTTLYQEKHKTLIKIFKVIAIIIFARFVLVFGYIAFTHTITVPRDVSYVIDIKENNAYIDSDIRVDFLNDGYFFIMNDQGNYNYTDIERIEIYFDEVLIHDSNNISELHFSEESSTSECHFIYEFDYDFETFKSYGENVSEVIVIITLTNEVKTYQTFDYTISYGSSGRVVPIWVTEENY